MTNLFYQYEKASQMHVGTLPGTMTAQMSTTAFINVKMETEAPIFVRSRVNYDPPHPLTHLVASSNRLVLALANKALRRFHLKNPEAAEDMDISKFAYQANVCGLFMDPLGHHVLVSIKPRSTDGQSELLYVSSRNQKVRQANKFKGHQVTAVGWNHKSGTEASTGPILLGTTRGLIFEAEIGGDDRIFQSGLEQYWRQLPAYLPLYGARELDGLVFDLGKGSEVPITALEFRQVGDPDRYFILATTPTRLYQFVGRASDHDHPLLQQVFSNYLNIPESFQELLGNLDTSCLQFFSPPGQNPRTFAWMTGAGVYHGRIDPKGESQVTADAELLEYPPSEGPPLSLCVTEFHALILYRDRVQGVCTLDGSLVFEDRVSQEEHGPLLGMVKDAVSGTLWAYTARSVFKYKVTDEARNMWQVYVDRGEFELAKEYCGRNEAHLNTVLVRQAENLFEIGDYELSAFHFAQTQASFEETALKFLRAEKHGALKTFLCRKLDHLKHHEKTQSTMIILWVVELYLNRLGAMRDGEGEKSTRYRELEEEFLHFLDGDTVKECIGNIQGTVCKLLASHGDRDNLVQVSLLLKDYERVVQHHLHNGNCHAALQVLQKQGSPELFYRFVPTLVQSIPRETIDALILQGRRLQPGKLIPAFVLCDQISNEQLGCEIVRYLEYCVVKLGSPEEAVHNYLISLYASGDGDKLQVYLDSQGTEAAAVRYNPQYALRLCLDRSLDRACIHLYTLLGMHEEAVDMALRLSVDLAKQVADIPDHDDQELCKKLWLKIARHVVKEKNDIKQAMAFLQQCDLIKIEDVLPFFPGFITIDHFKDAICASLQEYNQHIQDLKEEMDQATKSAEGIRHEIQAFRSRHTVVRGQDLCSVCSYPLLSRAFYVFPCGHRFHSDCLVEEILPHLTPARKKRLADLQHQLASMAGKEETASQSSMIVSTREQVKADIDDIVASECLYCGDLMIRSLDLPFITDFEQVLKEWE